MFMRIDKVKILLFVILSIALFLRTFKIDQIPPSINWDEASVGYNGWTIAHFGKDEWGQFLPITFKSFGDDKSPVHVYFTAISVGILGLNEFSTRLPSALFGVLNVLLIFYLAKEMFKKEALGLIAAFFLAISPFNIQFSRFNHEANFALFFFMLALFLFIRAVYQKPIYLLASTISFCISMISYHSPKAVVPPMIVILTLLYFKKLWKIKSYMVGSILILIIFALLVFFNPSLLGLARASQTSLPEEAVKNTNLYKQTKNELLGKLQISWERYQTYFSIKYLFISGDPIPRNSIQTVGEFYKIDALFLFLGIFFVIYKRSRESIVLVLWALIAPIPAAMTGSLSEISHAARACLQMGSWHLIAASGFYLLINSVRRFKVQFFLLALGMIILIFQFKDYLADYYRDYSGRSAIEWQYGIKDIVLYAKQHPEYNLIYMTWLRGQPYIFFLYYLKTPLPDFLSSALYNNSESKSYNRITSFDRYVFEGWEPIEAMPNKNVLYALTPSEYDGLRHRSSFDVKKIIYYPPGETAFFIVSAK